MTISPGAFTSIRSKPKLTHSKVANSKPESDNPITLGKLSAYKKTAQRRGTWFKALSHIERSIIDLTVKYVDNIRSTKLAKIVTAIVEKLQLAIQSNTDRLVRAIGLPLARKISAIAVRLGNLSAASWAEDLAFAKYLTLGFSKT